MNNASFLRKANPYAKSYTEDQILAMFKEEDEKNDSYPKFSSKVDYWKHIAKVAGNLMNMAGIKDSSKTGIIRDWIYDQSKNTEAKQIFVNITKAKDEDEGGASEE